MATSNKIHCSNCKKEINLGDIIFFNECEGEYIFCEDCNSEIDAECSEIVNDDFIEDRLEFGDVFLDEEN